MESFYKYNIDRKTMGKGYAVYVYNANAKKVWNSLKYCYSFRTAMDMEKWIDDFKKRVEDWEKTKVERRANRKVDNTETSAIKSLLALRFGFKNVRVVRGRGTASGWIEAFVKVNKPKACDGDQNSMYGYCNACTEVIRNKEAEARKLAYQAMAKIGRKFGTYYVDDGYGSQRDEFLLSVRFD